LNFQKLQENQLTGSSFFLAECSCSFLTPFFLLDDGYIGFLSHFLKIDMSSLFIFEKKDGLSSGFLKGPRAYEGSFQKQREVCMHFLKTQMKFKSYLLSLHKNLKQE